MIYHAIRVSIRIDPLGLAQASLKGYLSNYTVSKSKLPHGSPNGNRDGT